jgi:hypothetical protein
VLGIFGEKDVLFRRTWSRSGTQLKDLGKQIEVKIYRARITLLQRHAARSL